MKAQELRDLTEEELQQKEAELKRKLFTLRFQVATGQQDNTAALKETKRDIARVKTVLSEQGKNKRAKASEG
ncbi:MAG: 50S ribosomal protein L29 [Candidatus Fraserbacteria bacterium RBG_16_55_9]|uniref:Large ribosomal subunit protein uL29 n=1 Tax=Fraserbacteria sp. (strain RBG_16_55_9) TaxID=1817864 RepID=A0A1F5UPG3_FRAXR|nr:MAG: 50S ribosomal protein L29 [Candidatus Fraserbacteria bacterium RBG_16_55_9]